MYILTDLSVFKCFTLRKYITFKMSGHAESIENEEVVIFLFYISLCPLLYNDVSSVLADNRDNKC